MQGLLFRSTVSGVLLFHCLLAASDARAGGSWGWGSNATNPVPEGAKVTLETDRSEFFLGENVLVHFSLENKGIRTFEADFGGDYRGATRALRFNVTATDASGRIAEDPDPSGMCMGGFGGPRILKPGEKFAQSLPLMRYCRIVEPGKYKIEVTHDFGWKDGERKRPVGEITVTFRMPTAKEAERVVEAMEKLPAHANNTYGERAGDYADFTCLRQPIYLKPLRHRAEKGDQNALEAICWIETRDATAALIELATNSDPKTALAATQTLSVRLPDPALESTNGFGGFSPFTKEVRRRLVKNSWDPALAPAVRSLATNLVAKADSNEVSAGAFVLQAVGTPNEAASILAAMDRVLDTFINPRRDSKDNILDQPEPVRELSGAMNVLRTRGYAIDEAALRGGAIDFVYFTWLADRPGPRSESWLEMVKRSVTYGRFPMKVAALNSIPQPMPDECVDLVKESLSDRDFGVCRTACNVAGKSGNKAFLKPMLEIIATEHHEWLLREATEAANKLDAGYELLDAWANRLAEEELYGLALDSLQTVIEGLAGGSSGRTDLTREERIDLRNAWSNFLTKHEKEIRSGKKFRISDPALTPALFGRARTWQLPNGKFWPMTLEDINRPPR